MWDSLFQQQLATSLSACPGHINRPGAYEPIIENSPIPAFQLQQLPVPVSPLGPDLSTTSPLPRLLPAHIGTKAYGQSSLSQFSTSFPSDNASQTRSRKYKCTWEGCSYACNLPKDLKKHGTKHVKPEKEKCYKCPNLKCEQYFSRGDNGHRHTTRHCKFRKVA